MAREKVDNKLNVVIGTKTQIYSDASIPENSIVIVTDEELKANEVVHSDEKNVKEAIEDLDSQVALKVNTSDIVDDLVSSDVDKPLSAKQGKVLNDTTAKLSVSNVFTQPQQVPNATLPQHTTNLSQVETMFEMFKQQLRGYNFAKPDLSTATDLGGGNYRLYDDNGITIEYDVYSGINKIDGTATNTISYYFLSFSNTLDEYRTVSVRYVSGTVISGNNEIGIYNNGAGVGIAIRNNTYSTPLFSQTKNNVNQLLIYIPSGAVLTNYQFKLQLEKGDTATPYTLPGQIPQYKIVGEE